ncbi:procathepsin L-like [Antedon mediterranea]|uniref:procathepsin L-like n=1 Tax=Antedon mediterranea TaxID=105859 RepID=UPI003AF661C6
MKLFLCVLLIGAAVAMPNHEWEKFKRTFDKTYTPGEEIYRQSVFEDNQKFIQKHNAEFAEGLHTYTVGINKFADFTNAEFVSFFNGNLRSNKTRGSTYLRPSNFQAPTEVDWRKEGYVTPVKNQGQCDSSWAFSAIGSLEGQHFKKYNKLISLSEQQLLDCSNGYGNNGCEGGLMDNGFKYIKANGGIASEANYPYNAENDMCKFDASMVAATVNGYIDVMSYSEDLLNAVAAVGPISASMDATHASFMLYHTDIIVLFSFFFSNVYAISLLMTKIIFITTMIVTAKTLDCRVYRERSCNSAVSGLDHAVLVVGYGEDSDTSDPYWLVKNSWGTAWGMEGYFKITRKDNMCGIATLASYPLV